MNIIERHPRLATIIVIAALLVIAALPVTYEDMQLYDGPIRFWDVAIPSSFLMFIVYFNYIVQENGDELK